MDIAEQIRPGRRQMVAAFVRLLNLAREAGVDENAADDLNGLFFDGNRAVNEALSQLPGAAESPRSR